MVHSASPHESTLIPSFVTSSLCALPRRVTLLYDKAADSEPLRERLRLFGVPMISPFKRRTKDTQPKLTERIVLDTSSDGRSSEPSHGTSGTDDSRSAGNTTPIFTKASGNSPACSESSNGFSTGSNSCDEDCASPLFSKFGGALESHPVLDDASRCRTQLLVQSAAIISSPHGQRETTADMGCRQLRKA